METKRIVSFILAAATTLPLYISFPKAAQPKNLINISEEQFIKNGTFDEAANINDDSFGFDWHKHTDGMWNYSCNSGANAVLSYDEENRYLHVDASGWPSISYGIPGIIPAGNYELSFDIYVESGTTDFKFRAHRMTGTTSSSDFTGELPFTAASGSWKNISFPISLSEDSDILFRFYPAGNSTFRIDNVAIGVPGDTLIESADLDKFSANSVRVISPSAPIDKEWTASKQDFVTFDTSSDYLTVKRNAADKLIPGTPTIAYCFDKSVSAGEYRVSFDISSANAQKYQVEIYNGNNEGQKFYPLTTILEAFTFKACSYDITVPEGTADALIAFRLFPVAGAGEYRSQPYFIDNVRLDKKESGKTILEENFDNPNNIKVYNKTPNNGYTGVDWGGMASVGDGYWFLMDGASGTQTTSFGPVTATLAGKSVTCLKYDRIENNTPSFGYAFGALPRGKYIVTFDTFAAGSATISANNATGQAVRLHYGSSNTELPVTASIIFKNNEWATGRIEFEVTNDNLNRYLFRFWGCPDFYLDNFKITAVYSKYEWQVRANDLSAVPPNTASDGKMSPENTNYVWRNIDDGEWAYSGTELKSMTYDAADKSIFVERTGTPAIGHAPYGKFDKGDYVLKLDLKAMAVANFNFDIRKVSNSADSSLISPFPAYTLPKDTRTTVTIPFTLTEDTDIAFRFWGNSDFYIYGYAIEKLESSYYNNLVTADYSSGSDINTVAYADSSVTTANAKQYKGKWVSRDLPGMKFVYDNAGKRINVTHSEYVYGNAAVQYGFGETFTRGEYTVDLTLHPQYSSKYNIQLVNRKDNTALYSITTDMLPANTPATVSMPISTESDTDAVLLIKAAELTCYSPFTVTDVSVYKQGYSLSGLTSNGTLAMFDGENGIYYMSKDPSGSTAYLNYVNGQELRAGKYLLSGYFRTGSSEGAELTASVGYLPCEETFPVNTDWTYVEFPVTLRRKTALEAGSGIRFTVSGNSTFYFKDLSLTFEEDLPKPAMNSGIAMVLLKKLQGEMKPQVPKELFNFANNGDFSEPPIIATAPLKYEFTKAVPETWAYSASSENSNIGISYADINGEKCLRVSAGGTTPCVSYLIPGTLDAGAYTVSVDIYGEGAGTKGYSFDVFEISTGATVRIGENGAIMTRNAKAGEWVTVTFPFTLTSRGKVLFRFWGGSPFDYSIDNVTVTRPGVYADGTSD